MTEPTIPVELNLDSGVEQRKEYAPVVELVREHAVYGSADWFQSWGPIYFQRRDPSEELKVQAVPERMLASESWTALKTPDARRTFKNIGEDEGYKIFWRLFGNQEGETLSSVYSSDTLLVTVYQDTNILNPPNCYTVLGWGKEIASDRVNILGSANFRLTFKEESEAQQVAEMIKNNPGTSLSAIYREVFGKDDISEEVSDGYMPIRAEGIEKTFHTDESIKVVFKPAVTSERGEV